MTIHVSKDAETAINAAVQSGQFASADEMVGRLVQEYTKRHEHQPAEAAVPAWQQVLDNMSDVPDEDFARMPADSSEQLDHYLYGTRKRPTA